MSGNSSTSTGGSSGTVVRSNFKIDIPALSTAAGYPLWRFQILCILDTYENGLRVRVEDHVNGVASAGTVTANELNSLNMLKGAIVSKLSGEALQAAQLRDAKTFVGLVQGLDRVFRPDNLVERQKLLVEVLTKKHDSGKESLASFLSIKENALRNRLKDIAVDDLLMLSWTTLLPPAYASVCSDLRSTPGVSLNTVKSRLLEHASAVANTSPPELEGNVLSREVLANIVKAVHKKIKGGKKGGGKQGGKSGGKHQTQAPTCWRCGKVGHKQETCRVVLKPDPKEQKDKTKQS